MIICSRAPLRIGLAGGGSDLLPYRDRYGGLVINATINKFVHAKIETSIDKEIKLKADDLEITRVLKIGDNFELNGILDLHVASYNYFKEKFNDGKDMFINLSTSSDVPAGSGLGSSSTLVVAIVHAFSKFLDLSLSKDDIAYTSYIIERKICNISGGMQDQYAASYGGFNYIEFLTNDKTKVHPLSIDRGFMEELEMSILLYYTGRARKSSKIIEKQVNKIIDNIKSSVEATHLIKENAREMKNAILAKDLIKIADLMNCGWEYKLKSSNGISNKKIDTIYQSARDHGALSGKISGAGGGGYMLFLIDPLRKKEILKTLQSFSGTVLDCSFTNYGSEAWEK